jgi:hypothetical protein
MPLDYFFFEQSLMAWSLPTYVSLVIRIGYSRLWKLEGYSSNCWYKEPTPSQKPRQALGNVRKGIVEHEGHYGSSSHHADG